MEEPPRKHQKLTPAALLRHQNRELQVKLGQVKGTLAETQQQLKRLEQQRDVFDATTSAIQRAWGVLEGDLLRVAQQLHVQTPDVTMTDATATTATQDVTGLPEHSRLMSQWTKSNTWLAKDVTRQRAREEDEDGNESDDSDSAHDKALNEVLDRQTKWTSLLLTRLVENLLSVLQTRQEQQQSPEVNPYDEDLIRMYSDLREMDSKCRTIVAQLAVMKKSNRELDDELDRTRDQVTTLKRRVAHLEATGAGGGIGTVVPVPQRGGGALKTTATSTTSTTTTMNSSDGGIDVAPAPTTTTDAPNQQDVLIAAAKQLLSETDNHEDGENVAHYRDLATNRLEELQATKHMLASTASLLLLSTEMAAASTLPNATPAANKNGSSQHVINKELINMQRELADLKLSELRAQRLAAYAGKELSSAIKKIEELENASTVVVKHLESETVKEKKLLESIVEQLRSEVDEKSRQIAKLTTEASRQQDAGAVLAVVSERNELLSKQLEHERGSKSSSAGTGDGNGGGNNNNDDTSAVDVYVAEIESTHQTLAASQKAAMELLSRMSEKDARIQHLLEERQNLESELRAIREEKTAMVLKNNKEVEMNSQYHAHRTRLEARLSEAIKSKEKAEELAVAHQALVDRAMGERDEMRLALERALENEYESKERLKPLEEELKSQCERLAEARYDLGRSQEKQKKMRERLEKLQTVVEQISRKRAAEAMGTSTSSSSMVDTMRYEAMESALRCPVYPNLWKDCVITKCSHMFSKQALMDNLAQRNRKCPTCKSFFSDKDIVSLYLYQQNEE